MSDLTEADTRGIELNIRYETLNLKRDFSGYRNNGFDEK
jgi:hypothetical protein